MLGLSFFKSLETFLNRFNFPTLMLSKLSNLTALSKDKQWYAFYFSVLTVFGGKMTSQV